MLFDFTSWVFGVLELAHLENPDELVFMMKTRTAAIFSAQMSRVDSGVKQHIWLRFCYLHIQSLKK